MFAVLGQHVWISFLNVRIGCPCLQLHGGKGAIYVLAAGNGSSDDDCNTEGYENSIYTSGIFGVAWDHSAWICRAVFRRTSQYIEGKSVRKCVIFRLHLDRFIDEYHN
ncbi:hypothetical protein DPMN_136688 [Dreissena polymorpha]|uniref:Uncharacterized protein n=1 Tax=Dreissena polymorpha TaxID=45954 RepID=A0A9D4G498_DREPO|nr:hypothetical protein DPMN_136688 [Dreissena polymorpha]